MTDDISHIFKESKNITLSAEKKSVLRARLITHMALPETPIPSFHTDEIAPIRSPFVSSLFVFVTRPLPVALLIVILLGGGIVSAAEGTLPGDTLYSFKVRVNENVASLAAVTPEAKREWNTRRIERRLLEAEELAAHGDLDKEAGRILTAHITAHVEDLRRDEDTDEDNDTGDTLALVEDADLDARLSAHETILSQLVSDTDQSEEAGTILLATRAGADLEVRASAKMDEGRTREVSPEPSMMMQIDIVAEDTPSPSLIDEDTAQRMSKKARTSFEETFKLFDDEGNDLSEEVRESVLNRLHRAEDLYEDGAEKVDDDNYEGAFEVFKQALEISEEARIVILTTSKISVEDTEDTYSKNEKEDQDDGRDTETEYEDED
ncbi:MAG: hypothetical protein AAB460_00770 [Patescibacteria group bacterium]